MNNIKIHCSWDLKFDLFSDKQIELFVDYHQFNFDNDLKGSIKFLFILEPEEISPNFTQIALQYYNKFDYILTHNETILKSCPNAYLFEFGSTWIKNYEFPKKEFEVSTLVGGKAMVFGHGIRHQLWNRQNEIGVPKKIFLSGNYSGDLKNINNNPILGSDKKPLFNSQFHIVIENVKRKYWFTEKLIDCLITKTIPIYYGCPNIGDYFNLDGFYICDSADEIINACNKLTPEIYEEKIKFVEENYEKAKLFANLDERLAKKITELLK